MPVVLEWAKAVVSPPFYWRNLTWTRYSPEVPGREEFESSDKQSREPPEKYNYGERCIRCAEAIRLSPNALWNRRASFELKTARLSTLPLSGLDTCALINNSTELNTCIRSMLALHLTVHPNMDRASFRAVVLRHRTPRASLGRVPCIKEKKVTGPGSDLRRGRTGRAGKHSCARRRRRASCRAAPRRRR